MLKINHKIPTLAECREIASRKPEFREIKKSGYVVFDYNLNGSHTFDDDGALEMRGIAFHEDGTLASLGLHKFFNLGEKPNQNIVLDGNEEFLTKLDGSMIRVIRLPDGTWRLGTRAGETDVSELADDYVTLWGLTGYDAFIEHCLHLGLWPIFEFWSHQNRVVIDYGAPFLTLIAVRTMTGDYLSSEAMKLLATPFEIPVVKPTKFVGFGELSLSYKGMTGIEGFVVRTNGDWVKLKTDEYCQLHKAVDGAKFDKDIARMVLDGTVDDVIAMLPEPRKSQVIALRDKIIKFLARSYTYISSTVESFGNLSRKEIAGTIKDNPFRAEIFSALDGDLDDALRSKVYKAASTIHTWAKFEKDFL
jgi:T4 RnlA family RNA ligase